MPTHTLRVTDASTHTPPDGKRTLRTIEAAIRLQLRDVASAWGQAVWDVVDATHRNGFHIVLLDNEGQGSDLGYHDLDPEDHPYARVFLDPILDNGGHWLSGSLSVSATASHEACELVVDPDTNRWAQNTNGSFWSLEVCDPVEAFAYTIRLPDGTRVSVSDFVHPAWFDPFATPRATFDHTRRVHGPFHVAPGGYATRAHNGNVRNVWGPNYPRWRKHTKTSCGSRTLRRHAYGKRCC